DAEVEAVGEHVLDGAGVLGDAQGAVVMEADAAAADADAVAGAGEEGAEQHGVGALPGAVVLAQPEAGEAEAGGGDHEIDDGADVAEVEDRELHLSPYVPRPAWPRQRTSTRGTNQRSQRRWPR